MTYEARPIKRKRRTKAEMDALRAAIHDLALDNQVCTVRQIYYLGIGRYWDKDTGGKRKNYSMVVRLAGQMREDEQLPWHWISDNTRWVRRPNMYLSADDALESWISNYRRDLWAYQPNKVEVWCESDSIAGVIQPITLHYGVELFVCRGQSSKAYVREAAMDYKADGRPVQLLYVGDWDPSGLAIENAVSERMARYGEQETPLQFQRVAVTAQDVRSRRFTSHASNRKDTNFKRFKTTCSDQQLDPDIAIEVEAIPPRELRQRLENAIEGRMDGHEWDVAKEAEQSEIEHLQRMKSLIGGQSYER